MAGLQATIIKFLIFSTIVVSTAFVANSLGLVLSATLDVAAAGALAPLTVIFSLLFAGTAAVPRTHLTQSLTLSLSLSLSLSLLQLVCRYRLLRHQGQHPRVPAMALLLLVHALWLVGLDGQRVHGPDADLH